MHYSKRDILLVTLYIIFIVLLCILLFAKPPVASAETFTGVVCPAGDTKYEVDSGYEYGENIIVFEVTNDDLTLNWRGYDQAVYVDKICIKIGGPNGGDLIYPSPNLGTWTSDTYAISHAVGWKVRVTAVDVVTFTATPNNWWHDAVMIMIVIIFAIGIISLLAFIFSAARGCGRLDDYDEEHKGIRRS